ncbi:MAG: glycerophosphodiester phosphodiesterase [Anaerolineales bacterium]|jgi:glycerophosphoryl diester phosphodiesterase
MLQDLPTPAIFAHRGASAHAPENTLPSFQLALDQHADGIELDVTLSADGQVVVIHDSTIDRTTNGEGTVKGMDYAAIQQFDAGSWYGETFEGTHIPTLDEVLALVGDRIFTNIEIKPFYSPMRQLVGRVAEVVSHHDLGKRVIFSSFNPRALVMVHRLLPSVPVGFLLMPGFLGALFKSIFGKTVPYSSLHPHYSAVSPKMIRDAGNNGYKIFAYTVNQTEDMRRLFTMGIDGIITDNPAQAIQVRTEGA